MFYGSMYAMMDLFIGHFFLYPLLYDGRDC